MSEDAPEDSSSVEESEEPASEDEPIVLDLRPHWSLDSSIIFLNHGSFGACPRRIQNHQTDLQKQIEAEPVRFFTGEYMRLLDRARAEFSEFLGARPENLAFVTNATEGVNSVLRSLDLRPDDEILITDHGYGACNNACHFVADRAGARVVVASLPFPVQSTEEIVEAIVSRVTDKTRLAVIDHITSASALILPIEEIVTALKEKGVETLVDGAHAPGMVDLNLDKLGAAYFAGNCHKWLCAPRGAAFLHVRDDLLDSVRPLSISHGAAMEASNQSRFHLEFDWTGTRDPTAWLCIPEVIRFLGSLLPGRWESIRQRNHQLAVDARTLLCDALDLKPACPESMLGFMASIELPLGDGPLPASVMETDPLQETLFAEYGIQVPIFALHGPPRRLLRISAHLYNQRSDYEKLATALSHELVN